MAHHIHFLQRLARVDGEERRLALLLYYDSELVDRVLRVVPLPPGWTRVCVSLGDLREGPFVILANNGAFVTCLGRGMRVNHLIISRDRFDVARRHLERERRAA